MRPSTLVRVYYEALDGHHYRAFDGLLTPGFVHERGDRTLEGRETFVSFMRDDRPKTDTTHHVEAVYPSDDGSEVAVRGRLHDADGSRLFDFVDVHTFDGECIAHLRTYTRR